MTGAAPHHPDAGYTLIELLVVLAIMGMIAGVALPLLSAGRPGIETKALARALASDLQLARQDAISRNTANHVVLRRSGSRYALWPVGTWHALPQGIGLSMQGGEIAFYPDGSTSGGTILVEGGGVRRRVDVRWPTGRIDADE
jgi:general secretion pathway protein H